MKSNLIIFLLLFITSNYPAYAQISGNEAYNKGYNYSSSNRSGDLERLYINDSSFIINAKVLYNIVADSYVAVFGLSQESTNLKDCDAKIEERIEGFSASLQKAGISPENIYTEMTTQNKIYDYKLNGNLAEEYLQGFEIKKNVIVRFKNIGYLEKMIILAADRQIYDLVKVDYIVEDIDKVYTKLFQSAMEVINQKKLLYTSATNMKILPNSHIYAENFYCLNPNQLYKSYKAYESGDIKLPYNSSYQIKDIRKSQTFYYDKTDYSGFDKVINPSVTEPAIEYALELEIKYDLDNQKKK
jgi:uncharacterized protein YggE